MATRAGECEELKGSCQSASKRCGFFSISVPDKPLTNIELVRYARLLKIADFRSVFMRDTLPQYPLNVECGIVNFNTSNPPGSH